VLGTFVSVQAIIEFLRRLLAMLASASGRLAPEAVIQRLAAAIRAMPPERLEKLMRTPVRRVVLEAIFWQMPRHLDRRKAAAVTAAIRWRIGGRADGGEDVYDLVLADGNAHVKRRGQDEAPRLTITIDGAEFLRVAVGSSNPVNAYLGGKLELRGDVMQAARLTMLFRIPTTGRPAAASPQPPS
jgi:putative sterol carrier protein